MTEPGDSWERRAAGLASEVQRWLIKTSARNMLDELGDQVKKAFRGQDSEAGDVWATATTEPPRAADQAPECAWCPICRAARRIAESREATDNRGGPRLSDAADVLTGAIRDALAGFDSVLSYRPEGTSAPKPGSGLTSESPAAHGTADTGSARPPATEPSPAEAMSAEPSPADAMSAEPSPAEPRLAGPSLAQPGDDQAEEPEDDPGHRG